MDPFNTDLLQQQIDAAGIPNSGVNSQGVVSPLAGVEWTAQQLALIQSIKQNHIASQLSTAQLREEARLLLVQGKEYLRGQLEQASPASVTAQVAIIKPIIDGNLFLTRRMTNLGILFNAAHGWSVTLNPTTDQNRARYLAIVIWMISLET